MSKLNNIACWVAFHLVPRRLAYWCAVRVMAEAASANPTAEVPALTAADCLKAWEF